MAEAGTTEETSRRSSTGRGPAAYIHNVVLCPRLAKLDLAEEALGHGGERLLGPWLEPIDDDAIDERGESSGPYLDWVADGREAEDDVQIVSHQIC